MTKLRLGACYQAECGTTATDQSLWNPDDE